MIRHRDTRLNSTFEERDSLLVSTYGGRNYNQSFRLSLSIIVDLLDGKSFEDQTSTGQRSENTAWPLHRKRTYKQRFPPLSNLLSVQLMNTTAQLYARNLGKTCLAARYRTKWVCCRSDTTVLGGGQGTVFH
jgi:hypothetical protein